MINIPVETIYRVNKRDIIANFYFEPKACITAFDDYHDDLYFRLRLTDKHVKNLKEEIEGIKNGTLTYRDYGYYDLKYLYLWENELKLINYFRENGYKETDKIFISLY